MSHLQDNVRSLVCPQVIRTARRHKGVAQVIHFPHRGPRGQIGPVIAFSLLAIAISILLVTMFALAAREGGDVLGRLIPGWPWR